MRDRDTVARTVAVLYGEPGAGADEQDVLQQVAAVAAALAALGYRAEPLALTLDLEAARRELLARRPQLVFNLVESLRGQGRYIACAPALLDDCGLVYTGAPLTATFVTSNKLVAKRLLAGAGLPTPVWFDPDADLSAPGGDGRAAPGAARRWLVKSVWEHASIGIDDDALVDAAALAEAIAQRRRRFGGDWFGERYVDGREFNLALLAGRDGFEVLPPAEIVFDGYPEGKPRIVGYAAKWQPASFEYRHTPRRFAFPAVDRPLLRRLGTLALRCARLLQPRGYLRVDFRVDAAGRPWVLELNTNPCLSPDAGFAAAAARAGLSLNDVVRRIVDAAGSTAAGSTAAGSTAAGSTAAGSTAATARPA